MTGTKLGTTTNQRLSYALKLIAKVHASCTGNQVKEEQVPIKCAQIPNSGTGKEQGQWPMDV